MSMSSRAVTAVASAATLAVFGVAAVGVTTAHHTVTVSADGLDKVVSGFYPDVDAAVSAANVELDPYDQLIPDGTATLTGVNEVQVLRAHPYTVHTPVGTETAWSAAVSLDEVFDDVAAETKTQKITVSRGYGREALPLTVTAGAVSVTVDGKQRQVTVVGGESVGEILTAAGVEPGPLDSVFAVPTDLGVGLDVTTEQREITVQKKKIAFKTDYVDDPDSLEGTDTVTQEGKNGQRTIRTYTQTVGGEVTLTKELSNRVTREPVRRIISVGTKTPEPEPAANSTSASPSGSAGTDVSNVQITGADAWAALAQCESGGNPSANTGNGYYGMYQFSLSTWQSVGGTGLPSDASAEEQTQRAQVLQERSGWGQWPACSASLGLR